MTTVQNLLKYLTENDIEYTMIDHNYTKSGLEISLATHLPARYIAQTIPMQIDGHTWMLVIPANRRINFNAISRVLQAKKIMEGHYVDWIQFLPDCDLNIIPPFGNLFGFKVLADSSLKEGGRIIFSACSHTRSIFMRWNDYYRLVQPIVADISKKIDMFRTEKQDKNSTKLQDSVEQFVTSKKKHKLDEYYQNYQN